MPSRTTYVRRLDRGLMLDICTPDARQPTAASPTDSWINNGKKISSRQIKSQVPDDFSLPNVPGGKINTSVQTIIFLFITYKLHFGCYIFLKLKN